MSIGFDKRRRGSGAPRLGFLGTGWIGRDRLAAIRKAAAAEIAVVADESAEALEAALAIAPEATTADSLSAMLAEGVDGVVIATPSALHASQSIEALRAGVAVFCQKPLGRSSAEVDAVIAAADAADRLLGVDLSYRRTQAMQAVRRAIQSGELGRVFAAELVFHNAYGPDKDWYYDRSRSGGGCLADLGVHMIDLALWALDDPSVTVIDAHLVSRGRSGFASAAVEDFAQVLLRTSGDCLVTISCSWNLHAGQDAVIGARFFGERGGASFSNVDGSFYDFRADLYQRTSSRVLFEGTDEWGGRTAVEWARRLAVDPGYDPSVATIAATNRTIDTAYRLSGLDAANPEDARSRMAAAR
ncbi:MAG: Gfo/Idh/MocA family oxidoreductase [Rhizobiaceae bacterium]|nr:Gfo/Idh/MocA family oxidoreductase [Rhizobiaceae bacterium]MCV0407486.1 Gfo/Idh/MocA family oxidoreductase [Rhizobiaceae bacterium]